MPGSHNAFYITSIYPATDDEKVTIITIPVTQEGQGEEEVYNAVMNVEEFLAEHNIRNMLILSLDIK